MSDEKPFLPIPPAPTPTSYVWQQVQIVNNDGEKMLSLVLRMHTASGGHFTFWSGEEAQQMCREGLRLAKLTVAGQMDPTLLDAISKATQPREATDGG